MLLAKKRGLMTVCSEQLNSFVLKPGKTFEANKKTKLADAVKYMLFFGIFFAVLNTLILAVVYPVIVTASGLIVAVVLSYILNILRSVVGGAWLHIWTYILSARKGVAQTLKVSIYGDTPYNVLGWIPFVNIIALVWSLVLKVLGLMKLQGIGRNRAVAAIVVATVIPVMVLMLVIVYAMQDVSFLLQ
jgi:hypothetical protein